MAAAKIKKGDSVVVRSGKDKGRTGTVLQVMPKDGKVRGRRRQRRRAPPQAEPDQPAGRHRPPPGADAHFQGRASPIPRTASRPASASRPKDGKKVRVAVKSGETIDG